MESFDEFIRRTMSEQTHEFDEKYWLEAQRLLDEADRKRRRRKAFLWWFGGGTGVILLAVLTGWWAALLITTDDFQVEKTTADTTSRNAVLIEKNNDSIEIRIEKRISGESAVAQNQAENSTKNGGATAQNQAENSTKNGGATAQNRAENAAKNGGAAAGNRAENSTKNGSAAAEKTGKSPGKNAPVRVKKMADLAPDQQTIPTQRATARARRGETEIESGSQPGAGQAAVFSKNKNEATAVNSGKNDGQATGQNVDLKTGESTNLIQKIAAGEAGNQSDGGVQVVENQQIEPPAVDRQPFAVDRLPGLPIPFLQPPVRVILMPFFEWEKRSVLAGATDSPPLKKGWSPGFDGGFLLAKPDTVNRLQIYRTGIFAEKELKKGLFVAISLDYELMSGMNAAWPDSFSTKKYRFGLEPQRHFVELKQVSFLTPGVRFGWHFLPKNRLSVGLQMRTFLAARVRVNSTAQDPFGEAIDAVPPTQTGRWAKPPKTLNRFLPVASARYEIEPLGWLKFGAEASFQFNWLTDLSAELPARFDRRLFFGGYVRVNLK